MHVTHIACIMCMCMCRAGRRLPQRHSLRRGVRSQVRRSRWRVVRSSCARCCYRPLHPRAASPLRLPRPASPRPASPHPAPPRLRLARPRSLTRGVSRSRRCLTLTPTLTLTRRCLFGEYRLPLLRTPYMLIGAPHMPCLHTVRGCHRRAVAELDAHSPMQMLRTDPQHTPQVHCMYCTSYTACALLVHCIGAQFDTYQLDHDLGQCGHWGCEPRGAAELKYAWHFATATARLGHRLAVGQRLVYSSR